MLGHYRFSSSVMLLSKYRQILFFVDGAHRNGLQLLFFHGVKKVMQSIKYIVLSSGAVATGMSAVHNATGLLLCRFLLGMFEAGLFPGIIYYTSLWYLKREQAFRLGFFWSFSALAGAFGGLIAYAIAQIKSSIFAEWQLIFIVNFFFLMNNRTFN